MMVTLIGRACVLGPASGVKRSMRLTEARLWATSKCAKAIASPSGGALPWSMLIDAAGPD